MLEIRPEGGKTAFEPGAVVDVHIQWELEQSADSLELRLVCNTAGKGDQDLGIAQTWDFAGPSTRGEENVSITLPEAPYSFSGKLISCIWAWELIAFPSNDSTRLEFTLAPGAKEILLTSTSAEQAEAESGLV